MASETRSQRWRRLNPLKDEYKNLKTHAKARGIEFDLTFEQFLSIREDKCKVFNFALVKTKKKLAFNSRTYDRIDNTKGYTFGNVQCVSHKFNTTKGSMSPLEQIQCGIYFIKSNWKLFTEAFLASSAKEQTEQQEQASYTPAQALHH